MKLAAFFSQENSPTPYALSKYLNIQAANVYRWLKCDEKVPLVHCAKVEEFTEGKVTCEEMAPNFDWDALWAVYEGRKEKKTKREVTQKTQEPSNVVQCPICLSSKVS